MPANIIARAVTATKMASGTVQLVVFSSSDGLNSNGDVQFALVIPAADFTSFNTTVNGGAAGTTLTKVYAQNANAGDYVAADGSGVPRLGVLSGGI